MANRLCVLPTLRAAGVPRGRLARLLAGIALGAAVAGPAAAAERGASDASLVLRWSVPAVGDTGGRFRNCSIAARNARGTVIALVIDADRRLAVLFDNKASDVRPGDAFDADLDIDARWSKRGTLIAFKHGRVGMDLGRDRSALDHLRRGRVLTVRTEYGEEEFDLTGTAAALDRVERCLAEHAGAERSAGAKRGSPAADRPELAAAGPGAADAGWLAAQAAAYGRWLAGAQPIMRDLAEIVEHLNGIDDIAEGYRKGKISMREARADGRDLLKNLRGMHAATSARIAALAPYRGDVPNHRRMVAVVEQHLRDLDRQIGPMMRESEGMLQAALRGDEDAYRRGDLKGFERRIQLLQTESVSVETFNASIDASSPVHHLNAAIKHGNDAVVAALRQAMAYRKGEGPNAAYRALADRALVDLQDQITDGERLIQPSHRVMLRDVGTTPERRAIIGDIGNSLYASFAVEKKILAVLRTMMEAMFDPKGVERTASSAADLQARIDAALSELMERREALQAQRVARLGDLR
jgi:hypothetical protein